MVGQGPARGITARLLPRGNSASIGGQHLGADDLADAVMRTTPRASPASPDAVRTTASDASAIARTCGSSSSAASVGARPCCERVNRTKPSERLLQRLHVPPNGGLAETEATRGALTSCLRPAPLERIGKAPSVDRSIVIHIMNSKPTELSQFPLCSSARSSSRVIGGSTAMTRDLTSTSQQDRSRDRRHRRCRRDRSTRRRCWLAAGA